MIRGQSHFPVTSLQDEGPWTVVEQHVWCESIFCNHPARQVTQRPLLPALSTLGPAALMSPGRNSRQHLLCKARFMGPGRHLQQVFGSDRPGPNQSCASGRRGPGPGGCPSCLQPPSFSEPALGPSGPFIQALFPTLSSPALPRHPGPAPRLADVLASLTLPLG